MLNYNIIMKGLLVAIALIFISDIVHSVAVEVDVLYIYHIQYNNIFLKICVVCGI